MSARVKVFGGMVTRIGLSHRQMRAIVACSSQAKAAQIVGESIGAIQKYWSVTGNPAEVVAANRRPGVLLVAKPYEKSADGYMTVEEMRALVAEEKAA